MLQFHEMSFFKPIRTLEDKKAEASFLMDDSDQENSILGCLYAVKNS